MTGAGTAQSPYVPDNWSELKTAAETADAYIRLPEGAEWNMNSQYPHDTPGIALHCTEIDGNGSTISFLRKSSDTLFTMDTDSHDVLIKDLSFEKMYVTGARVFCAIGYFDSKAIALENVGIAGELYDSSFWYNDLRGVKTDHCAIDLELNNSTVGENGNTLLDTKLILNGNVSGSVGSLNLSSSAIYGELSTENQQSALILNGSLSVADITLRGFASVTYQGSASTMLLNTDKIGGASVSGRFIQATAAQMLDSNWLNAAGFPCGSAEE